jgi:hypothetical protein
MLTPRRKKEKPFQAKKRRIRVIEPKLKFEETPKGSAVIMINNDTYISFGNTDLVKWVSIRYEGVYGGVSKMFPVNLLKIPALATKAIGRNNIARVRELIRERLSDEGLLPRKKLMKMGVIINKENAE